MHYSVTLLTDEQLTVSQKFFRLMMMNTLIIINEKNYFVNIFAQLVRIINNTTLLLIIT